MTSVSDPKVEPKVDDMIRELKRRRGIVKGRLTNFKKYINAFSTTTVPPNIQAELKLRITGVQNLLTEFNDIQNRIEKLISDSDVSDQLSIREEFENEYYAIMGKAQCMICSGEWSTEGSSSTRNMVQSVKLPTISLPTFNGSCDQWLEFRDTFVSLIHNTNDLTNIQKFHYLKSSLSGNAQMVIDSVEFCASNYIVAWELLSNRYNNNKLLVHNHVKALFSIQALTNESPVLIRRLVDTVLKNVRALKSLGEPTEQWDTLLIYMVVSKLDPTTERQWEQYKITSHCQTSNLDETGDSEVKPSTFTINILLKFLKDRAEMLETLILSHSKGNSQSVKRAGQVQNNSKVNCNVATNNNKPKSSYKPLLQKRLCPMCNGKHPLYSCQLFLDCDVQSRLKLVRDKGLCENCFNLGHTSYDCRFGPCKKCEKKHNSLIHYDGDGVDENLGTKHTVALLSTDKTCNETGFLECAGTRQHNSFVDNVNNAHIDSLNAHLSPASHVLLSTAFVEILDCLGNYVKARAILDSGSERCFITQSLCDNLNTQVLQSTLLIRGVGNSVTKTTHTCEIEILSIPGDFKTRIQCLVLPKITSTMPHISLKRNNFHVPEHIQLADPTFHECQPIDLLIGADLFWDLIVDGRIRLSNGPYLQNTRLGWILSGPVYSKQYSKQVSCNFTQSVDMETLDTLFRSFWELEEGPISSHSESITEEERTCEDHFMKTTKRIADGRFCVQIPFKESPELLGETFPQAQNRFLALEKRLQRNPTYRKLYTEFMNEYLNLGHMTRVPTYEKLHYFMPHHGVLREHATTTKLRVVFDASARSSNGTSLNNLQMIGPAIQGDLISILLRFRENRYVACADVEKMYRQVLVDEKQRDLQLILWREDPSHPLGIYQLNTVTYGTASAPFLSCRCLKQLAKECTNEDVARVISEDCYVDDVTFGGSDIVTLTALCEETARVLESGCFTLRKWIFNFNCPSTENISKELSLSEHSYSKTLGLGWHNYDDDLYYHTQIDNKSVVVTKRSIFSHTAQIYDPLGLLSPVITTAKIIMQKLWLLKLDWDEPVPDDILQLWTRFVGDLSLLENVRIPRYVMCNNPTRIELHIFTDASQAAYGACAYVRTGSDESPPTVRLLCAKGKVAPVSSPITIPRLELCGALIGAKLYDKINNSLRSPFHEVMFWTDSTIILAWLRTPPYLLKPYVQNRITQIHSLTKEHSWRHVSGKINPADLVSRGQTISALTDSNLWWDGPQFLHDKDYKDTQSNNIEMLPVENLPETKPIKIHTLITNEGNESSLFPFVRFSQFNRMKRAAAYVLRFVYNSRNTNKRIGPLDVDELNEALITLAKLAQREAFPSEYNSLIETNSIKRRHALSKLNLFIDDDKVIRVGGRIENSPTFDYDKKHPILISSKHHFTRLLFGYEHKQLLHAPPQLLLCTIRNSWWPVGGRNLAKNVVHNCVTCVRMRGKVLNPIMGNLPKERLEPGFPFARCGVDYAGPVFILKHKGKGAKTTKAYICLFICFATRAVHLELVSDLSSDAYLLALKRFISRRGKPLQIFSDNGTNFVGLKNEFENFISSCSNDIKEYATSQNIKFSMNPPYASHFGGLWEAGIKSCKHHLKRVVGNAHLTFEEFSTVLTQVEAVLNSRPLSPMSTESTDFQPLTPAHFLVGRPLTAPVTAELADVPDHRLNRYQRVEQLRQHFWTRWYKEYVSELQTRRKWTEKGEDLVENTMVLIKDDNLPPLKWSLGRIIRTYPGKDGVSRVADIKVSKGVVRRAFSKICPLLTQEE